MGKSIEEWQSMRAGMWGHRGGQPCKDLGWGLEVWVAFPLRPPPGIVPSCQAGCIRRQR